MRISIDTKLRPFSRLSQTLLPLPGTYYVIRVCPTFLEFIDHSTRSETRIASIHWNIEGPVKEFLCILDLEKGQIVVQGFSKQGFFRYFIQGTQEEKGLSLFFKKIPSGFQAQNFTLALDSSAFRFKESGSETLVKWRGQVSACQTIYLTTSEVNPPEPLFFAERDSLSFGSHKALDWQLVQRRNDLKEILPCWFTLGQMVPEFPSCQSDEESLLNLCEKAIRYGNLAFIEESFKNLIAAGFHGLLTPRFFDADYQGLKMPPLALSCQTSLTLLRSGFWLIREMLISYKEEISILKRLPSEFVCGRFIGYKLQGLGTIDLEWSKHLIRKMIVKTQEDKCVYFNFPSEIRKFRLRSHPKDRGVYVKSSEPLDLSKNHIYLFDNFEK